MKWFKRIFNFFRKVRQRRKDAQEMRENLTRLVKALDEDRDAVIDGLRAQVDKANK
jgi:hypothetical protein